MTRVLPLAAMLLLLPGCAVRAVVISGGYPVALPPDFAADCITHAIARTEGVIGVARDPVAAEPSWHYLFGAHDAELGFHSFEGATGYRNTYEEVTHHADRVFAAAEPVMRAVDEHVVHDCGVFGHIEMGHWMSAMPM